MTLPVALAIAALAQQVPASAAVQADQMFAEARQAILQEVESGAVPSVAIGVALNGRILWLEAIGWADRERGAPATPGTIYPVGSLSKSITATAVLALVSQGRLSLETRVGTLLDSRDLAGSAEFARQVTVGHLLNSTAGIAHGWVSFDEMPDPATRPPDGAALVAFSPGAMFEYSNYSFGLLQRVVEETTCLPFEDALQQLVFDPLNLTRSTTRFDREQAALFSVPYDSDGSRVARRHNTPEGGLGLYSTATDLLEYGMYHAGQANEGGGGPIGSEWLARMREVGTGPGQGFFHLGWWRGGGGTRVSNGSIRGANAHLRVLDDRSAVVVVLTNQTGYFADEWAGRLTAILAPGVEAAGAESREEYGRRFRTPYARPTAWPIEWRGRLVTPGGDVAVSVTLEEEAPALRMGRGEAARLENASLNEFGELRGWFMGTISGLSPDDSDPHRIHVVARRDGAQLLGYVSAVYSTETAGLSVPVRLELAARN